MRTQSFTHVIKILKNKNLLGQIFSKGKCFIFGLFLQIMNCNFKWQFVFLVSHFFDCFCSNHKYQLFGNDINNCFIQRVDVVIVRKFGSIFTSIGNILSEERHTTYSKNNMCQKCGGSCGLWVLNEIMKKIS